MRTNDSMNEKDITPKKQSKIFFYLDRINEFIITNAKKLFIAAVVLFVIFSIFALYSSFQERKIRNIQKEVGYALLAYSGEPQIAALTTILETAPDNIKASILLPIAVTQQNLESYVEAEETYRELVAISENTSMYTPAQIGIAFNLQLQNKYPEALVVLQTAYADILKTKKDDGAPSPFETTILSLMASTAEQAQNTEVAIEAYEALLKTNPNEQFVISRLIVLKK